MNNPKDHWFCQSCIFIKSFAISVSLYLFFLLFSPATAKKNVWAFASVAVNAMLNHLCGSTGSVNSTMSMPTMSRLRPPFINSPLSYNPTQACSVWMWVVCLFSWVLVFAPTMGNIEHSLSKHWTMITTALEWAVVRSSRLGGDRFPLRVNVFYPPNCSEAHTWSQIISKSWPHLIPFGGGDDWLVRGALKLTGLKNRGWPPITKQCFARGVAFLEMPQVGKATNRQHRPWPVDWSGWTTGSWSRE